MNLLFLLNTNKQQAKRIGIILDKKLPRINSSPNMPDNLTPLYSLPIKLKPTNY